MQPKVTCLMATHGRARLVSRAMTMFLQQDTTEPIELLILNNHPVPLMFTTAAGSPGFLMVAGQDAVWRSPNSDKTVRVVNEAGHKTLGHVRNRMLQLATGEFIRTWDDDDLYLPWTLSQGFENIGDAPAFKPTRSWFCEGMKRFTLAGNAMEGSMLVRREVALKYGYRESGGDEHVPLLQGIAKEGGPKMIEFGPMSSYAYTWGCGEWHVSGSLGSDTIENRTRTWMEKNQDTSGVIDRVDVSPCWDALVRYAEGFDGGWIMSLGRRLGVLKPEGS